ncbi:hypothetical protein M5C99_08415 [Acidovorax sp. NCPPB 2350]|nr:hypothetical protein M5C99_08415 [Acidovorax sp. NCPPB 2350]
MRNTFALKSLWLGVPALCTALTAFAADEVPALTLPLASAVSSYLAQSGTQLVSGSGTQNGQSGTGSGTVTRDEAVPVTFEGQAALQKRSVVSLTLQTSSGTSTSESTALTYFDSNYIAPLGASIDGLYAVTRSSTPLPATAKAGDSGSWYSMNVFTDPSKFLRVGTATVNYSVQAETASTLLLSVTSTATPILGNPIVNTTTYRLGTSGAAIPLQEVTSTPGTNLTIQYQ